jgi:RNA-directed DNA polymerase
MKVNYNPTHFNKKLIHIVSDPEMFIFSYKIIKSKLGNSIPGIERQTLDNINMDWFIKTCKNLKSGKFKFKPARRVHIPKKRSKDTDESQKLRLLYISNPRDKIVQQAIYLILHAIYEPFFFDSSHGSRPNRGNHSALHYIKCHMNGVKWCVVADIDSNFLCATLLLD